MFDFELFMNACHADLEIHAGDVEDYIELDSGDLSNLSDYFSDDFKAKMGAEHMDSAHLVNQLKLESFTQSMSRIALHPPTQYQNIIISGLPSAGKSVALSRIGQAAVSSNNDDRVIHLFTMQYYTNPDEVRIRRWEDLWRIVLRCHVNDNVADSEQSLEEFVNLHKRHGRKLTVLIDTLDLLTYGVEQKYHGTIFKAWNELLLEFQRHQIAAIWTCRKHELSLLMGENKSDSNLMHVVELPRLNSAATRKRVNKVQSKFSISKSHRRGLELMIHAFPVVSRFICEPNTYRPSEEFIKRVTYAFTSMKFSLSKDKTLDPISWVMKKQNNGLGTDIMYKLIREKVIKKIVRSEISGIEGINTSKDLAQKWVQLIENRFFHQARVERNKYGSRLMISRELPVLDSYDSDGLSSNYTHVDTQLVRLFIHYGSAYGLFTEMPNFVSFSHQLFAEYCVWQRKGESEGSLHLSDQILVERYPSLALRFIDSVGIDENMMDQYFLWLSPFVTVSDLHNFHDAKLPTVWKSAIRLSAIGNDAQKSLSSNVDMAISPINGLNDQQEEIINQLPLAGPLFLNAPPGTGKTYIAANFIQKMVDEFRLQSSHQSPNVTFLTMSPHLSEHFAMERYPNHFERGKGYDDVVLNSLSVDELLFSIKRHVLQDFSLSWENYKDQLLTKPKFVEKVKSQQGAPRLIERYSIHGLWYEFNNKMLDRRGNLCHSLDEYKRNVGKARNGEYNTIFHQLNNNERSNNAERDAKLFIDILTKCGFIGQKNTSLASQSKICEDIIHELLSKDDPENEQTFDPGLYERLIPYLSDVVVIDEIQDLNFSVLKLALLLHRGAMNAMFFTGDDEQTLDWEPFDWRIHFSKAAEMIGELRDNFPATKIVSLNVENWWDGDDNRGSQLARMARRDSRKSLTEVERNFPIIVDYIRESFTSSVSQFYPREKNLTGTAAIVAGERIIAESEKARLAGIPSGITRLTGKLSESDFIALGKALFSTPNAPTIVLPSDEMHVKARKILAAEDINIALWHPISIKGLEYESVIALSPWSIDVSLVSESLDDLDLEKGFEHNDEIASKKGDPYESKYERLLGQRKRYSNVMLSRPTHHLIIGFAKSDEFDLYDTKEPNFSQFQLDNHKSAGLAEFIQSLTYLDIVDEEDGIELGASINYTAYVSMIQRMVEMVKSENAFENILYQGAHIKHIMEQRGTPANGLLEDYSPFLSVSAYLLRLGDQLSSTSGTSSHVRDKVVNYLLSGFIDGKYLNETHPVVAQVKRLAGLKRKIRKNKTRPDEYIVKFSPIYFSYFAEEFNRFLTELTKMPEWVPSDKVDIDALSSFIQSKILGGKLVSVSAEVWSNFLRNYDFKNREVSLSHENQVIPGIEILGHIWEFQTDDSYAEYWDELVDDNARFWKEGIQHLKAGSLSSQSVDVLWGDIENKLRNTTWTISAPEQVELLLTMIFFVERNLKSNEKSKTFVNRLTSFAHVGSASSPVDLVEIGKNNKIDLHHLRDFALQCIKHYNTKLGEEDKRYKIQENIRKTLDKMFEDNTFNIHGMFSTLGEERGQHFLRLLNGERSSRVYSHLPELVNDIFSLLCAHDVEPLKHNFSEFLREPNLSEQEFFDAHAEWGLDGSKPLNIVQSLIGDKENKFAIFEDFSAAEKFFKVYPEMIEDVLDVMLYRLYCVRKNGGPLPMSVGDILKQNIAGHTLQHWLRTKFNHRRLIENVFNCEYQENGDVHLKNVYESNLPPALRNVIFLSNEKVVQYGKENEFFNQFESYLSTKQREDYSRVREKTLSQPEYWRKEAVRMLGLRPHELKKVIDSQRITANFDFLLKDGKVAFKPVQLNDSNGGNIVLDAIVKRGIRSVFLPNEQESNSNRLLFFEKVVEAFDKDILAPYHYRFGNRLYSARIPLNQYFVLHEFIRAAKLTILREEAITDRLNQKNIEFDVLDEIISLSSIIACTRHVMDNSKTEDTAPTTLWRNVLAELIKRVLVEVGLPHTTTDTEFVQTWADKRQLYTAFATMVRNIFVPRVAREDTIRRGEETLIPVYNVSENTELTLLYEDAVVETEQLRDSTPLSWLVKETEILGNIELDDFREWRCRPISYGDVYDDDSSSYDKLFEE
tara:strand:+ start:2146 stop:8478 length:6333 start_codon:yes stop_codon:yes gene_type:complete